MERSDIFLGINNERKYQDEKYPNQHHTTEEWIALIVKQLGQVETDSQNGDSLREYHNLLSAGALCVAAIEDLYRD